MIGAGGPPGSLRPVSKLRRSTSGPAVEDEANYSLEQLVELLGGVDASDPAWVTAPPVIYLGALIAAGVGELRGDFAVADCLTLAHAYAQLGVVAEIRAAELVVDDLDTGGQQTYGTVNPFWEDQELVGHAVVWVPRYGHLIDTYAGKLAAIAARGEGPVVALDPGVDERDGLTVVEHDHHGLLLTHVLASRLTTSALLGSRPEPVADSVYAQRGMTLASMTAMLLARAFEPEDVARVQVRRAAALAGAVRGLEFRRSDDGLGFVQSAAEEEQLVPFEDLPLPAGTPLARRVAL
jgi:hypothetical protein